MWSSRLKPNKGKEYKIEGNYLIYNKEAKLKTLIILVIFMKGKILKNEIREQKFDCAYKNSIYRIILIMNIRFN